MTQDDVYRKVGRGGAGNYYSASKKTHDEKQQDLEAQRDAEPPAINTSSSSAPPAPARAGRGGAGNFTNASTTSAAAQHEQAVADGTQAAMVRQQQQQPSNGHGMSGRGGAGNWKHSQHIDHEAGHDDGQKHQQSNGAEMVRQAAEAVDMHLKMPEKAHRPAAKIRDVV